MTKLSRWVGVFEVLSECYEDDSPLFEEKNDPYVIRFKVKPLAWLEKDKTVPIHHPEVWNELSFTRELEHTDLTWTGKVRGSLAKITKIDGSFLENILSRQMSQPTEFPIEDVEFRKHLPKKIKGPKGEVEVQIPDDETEQATDIVDSETTVRISHQIQAKVAYIGYKMGFKVWIPNGDRNKVTTYLDKDNIPVLDQLPLNYEEKTLQTIENIDVLWISNSGRRIVRAFEVEHTTLIYSGLLRMADLRALQPNMDIQFHIVAPYERRRKVLAEIKRPVFALLDGGALEEYCTFISYDSISELAKDSNLEFLKEDVLSKYAEAVLTED